ncbi:hypothetical protein ACIHCQ_39865 [Streptomyces sp. NPDC052236]|uniref:hypothetical protein n=1 Tax=Streptomyces sp. NPDC052236 TaxID=3365686 RepID=UPI0037D2EA18
MTRAIRQPAPPTANAIAKPESWGAAPTALAVRIAADTCPATPEPTLRMIVLTPFASPTRSRGTEPVTRTGMAACAMPLPRPTSKGQM